MYRFWMWTTLLKENSPTLEKFYWEKGHFALTILNFELNTRMQLRVLYFFDRSILAYEIFSTLAYKTPNMTLNIANVSLKKPLRRKRLSRWDACVGSSNAGPMWLPQYRETEPS